MKYCRLHSNSDLRHISVFASPSVARRAKARNVYTRPDRYWLLSEARAGAGPDSAAVTKIAALQQQVPSPGSSLSPHTALCPGQCVPAASKTI